MGQSRSGGSLLTNNGLRCANLCQLEIGQNHERTAKGISDWSKRCYFLVHCISFFLYLNEFSNDRLRLMGVAPVLSLSCFAILICF